MTSPVYVMAPGLVTPLGFGIAKNFERLLEGHSAINSYAADTISDKAYHAAVVSEDTVTGKFAEIAEGTTYTKLEKMMLLAVAQTLENDAVNITDKTALIVATTKGNVDLLNAQNDFSKSRVYLSEMAQVIADFFNIKTTPIVLSNACVSGVLAVAVAKRILQTKMYDNAIVVAGDLVTRFTMSGFQSFQALSDKPCAPYSKYRRGITLGEAAASVYITLERPSRDGLEVLGDSSCNDANHISGPSRTGEGLYRSTILAMQEAGVTAVDLDFISAHGTATLYNDEMEAVAFNRAHLQQVPLHSLKGVYGHTLGAAGLLEAIIGMEMMQRNTLIPSLGFDELGISKPLNIVREVQSASIQTMLKTASGFGGCNTAVIFKKVS